MMTDLVSQWETECVDSCCIIMNIRLSETRNTFVANSRITGNHLVCIYYQFVSNVWVYADSLGYSPPDQLYQSLSTLRNTVQCIYNFVDSNEASLIIGHSHGFQGNKKCNNNCIQHFPYQGSDMNSCGLPCILSAAVLMNKSFASQILIHRRLTPCYCWFRNLDQYIDFLRSVLIIWYLDRRIDLLLINIEVNQTKVSNS